MSEFPSPTPDRVPQRLDVYQVLQDMADADLVDSARQVVLSATGSLPLTMPGAEVPRQMTHSMDFLVRTAMVRIQNMGISGLMRQSELAKHKLADMGAHLSSVFGIDDGSLGLNSVEQAQESNEQFDKFVKSIDGAQRRLYNYDYPAGSQIESQAMTGVCLSSLDFLGEVAKTEPLGDYARGKILGAVNNLESLSKI